MPESEPRLIRGYLEVLAAQLPGPVVEELADGLTETHRSYLSQGLAAEAAAEAAVEEFGSAEEILAGFARVNPARRTARRLLGFGPVVGGCWAAALATSRAWPGPLPTRVALGLALVSCIGLLAVAALDRRYRVAFYSGIAGCVGFAALDASLIVGVLVVAGVASWVTANVHRSSRWPLASLRMAVSPVLFHTYQDLPQ